MTLAELIATVPDLAGHRALEEATQAAMRARMEALAGKQPGDFFETGYDEEADSVSGYGLGADAIRQAKRYMAKTPDEHVLDGQAHHVFNVLRDGSPSRLDEAGLGATTFADVRALLANGIGVTG